MILLFTLRLHHHLLTSKFLSFTEYMVSSVLVVIDSLEMSTKEGFE